MKGKGSFALCGAISVEILNSDNKPIPGFLREKCDALTSDDIGHTVTWNGKANMRNLQLL